MIRRALPTTITAWLTFVILAGIIGAGASLALGVVAPPPYTARVILLVAPQPRDSGVTNGDVQVAQAYIPTLAELATIRPILDSVIASTGISTDARTLAESVTTHVPVATSLLTISVSQASAATAAAIANGIAAELIDYVATPTSGATGDLVTSGLQLDVTVVEAAQAPRQRDGPGTLARAALGAAIAILLALSVGFGVDSLGRSGVQRLDDAASRS